MILIVDNYDSFVHNLARYFRQAGAATRIVRNDSATVEECLAMRPSGVIISPGPKTPKAAGVSLSLLEALPPATPFLGVCLGHQCLAETFGGQTRRARAPLHGEASPVTHEGAGLFAGIPSPAPFGRYHSLAATLPPDGPLRAVAWSPEGDVMAIAHRTRSWFGVQFHPESLLSPYGRRLIENFIMFTNGAAA